jgi:hypothetical protein
MTPTLPSRKPKSVRIEMHFTETSGKMIKDGEEKLHPSSDN